MPILKFIGDTTLTSYERSPFSEFTDWVAPLRTISLDTETNVVNSILERKLKVVAIADLEGDTIWVFEWEVLNDLEQQALVEIIRTRLCIIQNVSFDYTVFKHCTGTKLEKVWDTMLAEQSLTNGYSADQGFHGLQAIYKRRFDLDISKEEQLSFGEGPYNNDQIQYAAIDVFKLGMLYLLQVNELKAVDREIKQEGNKGLMKTMWWENEFVKVVSDMEYTGVRIDKEKWYAIEDHIKPFWKDELAYLNKIVVEDFYDVLEDNDWISNTDTLTVNVWTSSAKKKVILDELFDFEVDKTSRLELKKLLAEHDMNFPEGLKLSGKAWERSDYPTTFIDNFAVIKLMIIGIKIPSVEKALNKFLLTNKREFCIEQGWIRPAGKVSLNWGSPVQRLKIFQAVNPAIDSTAKDVLVDYEANSRVIPTFLGWGEVDYQLKNFGKSFYDKHVEIDGKHRTRFNQILATGRLSSVSPNMLNIPRKNGGVYREAVIPDPGFKLIDADYDGQELVVVTELSHEPSWEKYMKMGYDLHSMNSALIFGEEWVQGAIKGCAFYEQGTDGEPKFKKCKCPVHEELRDNSKAVSFGSIYGISYFKLAFNLKISEDRAKFILKRFFEIVPAVREMMDKFGLYAIENGHIIEPVFGRVRYFDKWKLAVAQEHGSIERAAFNTPIDFVGEKSRELLETPTLKDVRRTISSQAA